MSDSITLAELSGESGIPARTIRFYIARGLLDGPVKAGRAAAYTPQHLARLEKIKNLQNEGRMLSEIINLLSPAAPSESATPPTAWWQHAVGDDLLVWVRGDVSPWRMKQIRAAINGLAAHLAQEPDNNERSHRK